MGRKWLWLLAVLVLAGSLAGCGGAGGAAQLGEGDLFSMEDEVCTRGEAMVFLLSRKAGYESAYGGEIWTVPVEGGTLADHMEGELEDFLLLVKCTALMAEQYEVSLSEEEEQKIAQAASAYMEAMPEETALGCGIDEACVQAAFRDYHLARRTAESLLDGEISEDAARVVVFQQIFWDTEGLPEEEAALKKEEAGQAKARAEAGEDFFSLAGEYSETEETEQKVSRGMLDPSLEEAVFSLSSGQVSEVIETDGGLYVVKCVTNYDREATAENKEALEKKQQEETLAQCCGQFAQTVSVRRNETAWETVDYGADYGEAADFYGIYEQYLGGF